MLDPLPKELIKIFLERNIVKAHAELRVLERRDRPKKICAELHVGWLGSHEADEMRRVC